MKNHESHSSLYAHLELQQLTSRDLLIRTQRVVTEERRATVSLIAHLEEIQARRLFAEIGFSSMWEFCTKYLKLSEGAAQRRIQAMRLVQRLPEAQKENAHEALASGSLSLSNAAALQSFLKTQEKAGTPSSDAGALIEQMANFSQQECQTALFKIAPQPEAKERSKCVSAEKHRELKFVVTDEVFQKLERIKGLIAHKMPNPSLGELTGYLATEVLARLEKRKGLGATVTGNATEPARLGPQPISPQKATAAAAVTPPSLPVSPSVPVSPTLSDPLPAGKLVYLPAALRRQVFAKSEGRCQFTFENRRCTSTVALELDHIVPLALNGPNELSNFRILCRQHNLQQCHQKLGFQF